MVRIPNPQNYEKFFTTHGVITCLNTEFLLKGPLGRADMVVTYRDRVFSSFISSSKKIICLKDGLKLFSDRRAFSAYSSSFKRYMKQATSRIIPKYYSPLKQLSLAEFEADVSFLAKMWQYYGFTEFAYTDLAFAELQKKPSAQLSRNLEELVDLKFEGRNVMNAYFFREGVFHNLLGTISQQYFGGEDASFLFSQEIIALMRGKKLPLEKIKQRGKGYAAMAASRRIIEFNSSQAASINIQFTRFKQTDAISGTVSNPGLARGRAVVSHMLADLKEIAILESLMSNGDILIAESTSPDIISLCKKASAIVAEQGGMLSHAAVVGRELGIPCIIGALNSTRAFKTGDYVEVDAFSGVVRKLKIP